MKNKLKLAGIAAAFMMLIAGHVNAQDWHTTGNAGPFTNEFLGTTTSDPVIIKTSGTERMRFIPGTNGFIGINNSTPLFPLDISNTNYLRVLNINHSINSGSLNASFYTTASNAGAGATYGIYSDLANSNGNGFQGAYYGTVGGAGISTHYGLYTLLSGQGTGAQKGIYNEITNTGDADHWGIHNYLRQTGNGKQYGSYNNITNSGSGVHYGTYNTISGNGPGIQYGIYNDISNTGAEKHYGMFSVLSGIGDGFQYGIYSNITNTGTKSHFGAYSSLAGAGTGAQFGYYSNIPNTGDGTHYGYYATLIGTGNGDQYGARFSVSNTGTGYHYGLYSSVSGDASTNYGIYSIADGKVSSGIYTKVTDNGTGTSSGLTSLSYGNGSGTKYAIKGYAYGTDGDNYGVYGYATSSNSGNASYAIYGFASGSSGNDWAGYFNNRVYTNKLYIGSTTITNSSGGGTGTIDPKILVQGDARIQEQLLIGTVTPASGYKLSVDGKIICEELRVLDSGSWPDYVFGDAYKLPPLEEVEQHIKNEKHLPGIPSSCDIEENGIAVGEMQKKLMEKIEELTLYVIDLKKDNIQLKEEMSLLKSSK